MQAVRKKCCAMADAPLDEVLHPAAEEELLGDCDKGEGEEIGSDELQESWPVWMEVQEAEV